MDGCETVLVGKGGIPSGMHEGSHNRHMPTGCSEVQRSATIGVSEWKRRWRGMERERRERDGRREEEGRREERREDREKVEEKGDRLNDRMLQGQHSTNHIKCAQDASACHRHTTQGVYFTATLTWQWGRHGAGSACPHSHHSHWRPVRWVCGGGAGGREG